MNKPRFHIGSMMLHRSRNNTNTIDLSVDLYDFSKVDFDGDEMGVHIPQGLKDCARIITFTWKVISLNKTINCPQSFLKKIIIQ